MIYICYSIAIAIKNIFIESKTNTKYINMGIDLGTSNEQIIVKLMYSK